MFIMFEFEKECASPSQSEPIQLKPCIYKRRWRGTFKFLLNWTFPLFCNFFFLPYNIFGKFENTIKNILLIFIFSSIFSEKSIILLTKWNQNLTWTVLCGCYYCINQWQYCYEVLSVHNFVNLISRWFDFR